MFQSTSRAWVRYVYLDELVERERTPGRARGREALGVTQSAPPPLMLPPILSGCTDLDGRSPAKSGSHARLPLICLAALGSLAFKALLVGWTMRPQLLAGWASPTLTTLALTALAGSLLQAIPARAAAWASIAVNAGGTLLLTADLWHSRFFGDALSVAQLSTLRQLPVVASSVVALMAFTDLWLAIDIMVLCVGMRCSPAQTAAPGERRRRRKRAAPGVPRWPPCQWWASVPRTPTWARCSSTSTRSRTSWARSV